MTVVLTPELLEAVAAEAQGHGLLRLSAVSLDDEGFAPARHALDAYINRGWHGEMEFMARTHAVRRDPAQMLPGAKTVLVALAPHGGGPGAVARYAQSVDYHTVLHRRLDPVVADLKARLPGVEAVACVDTKPLMERAAAALAGLGFLGKNGCLIAPGLGSYVLLGAILCTAVWTVPRDQPSAAPPWDQCGSCTRCLDACPTEAFVAPGQLDPRRCISYLTIEHRGPIADNLADAMGERVAGCDVCQEVCPYNATPSRAQRAPAGAWIDPLADGPREADIVALANVRSGRYRAFVRDTALRRIPRRSLRRNALIALGNRTGPVTVAEREAVAAAEGDDDPQVRDAATRVLVRRR